MTQSTFYSNSPRRFGRTWWSEQIRTMLWVAVVSALIWVYADMEFTQARNFTVTVKLTPGAAGNITLLSRSEVDATFRAEGNGRSLDEFERALKKNGNRIDLDVSAFTDGNSTEPVVVPMENILRNNSNFMRAGLTVVSPVQSISFQVDKVVTPEVPVKLTPPVGASILGDPVITPAKVRVRVARSLWARIIEKQKDPVLKTRAPDLQTKEPGTLDLTAEIIPEIESIRVEPIPSTVNVRLQIASTRDTYVFTANVRVQVWPSWQEKENVWKDYKLVREDEVQWRPQITVAGSRQDIDRLKAQESSVLAFIVLTEEDKKPVSWNSGKVMLLFPDDVHVEVVKGAEVRYRLEKRQ